VKEQKAELKPGKPFEPAEGDASGEIKKDGKKSKEIAKKATKRKK
jgi:hypothetical protein